MTIIGLHKGTGFISRAIAFFTKSPFTHAYLLLQKFKVGNKRYFLIYEASDHGIMPRIVKEKYIAESTLYQYDESGIYESKSAPECVDMLINNYEGKSYGYLQLFGFAIYYLLLWIFRIKLKDNPIRGGRVCSEFVYLFLQCLYDTLKLLSKSEDLITPKDIEDILEQNKKDWIKLDSKQFVKGD